MPPLLLFDGHCNLCNATVSTFLALDRRYAPKNDEPRINFCSLQSEAAAKVLQAVGRSPDEFIVPEAPEQETVCYIDEGLVYVRSSAIMRAFAHLAPTWLAIICYLLLYVVPPPLRDFVYKRVARNRIWLFGSTDTCRRATAADKKYFL